MNPLYVTKACATPKEILDDLDWVELLKVYGGSSHFDGPENWIHGLMMSRIEPTDSIVVYREIQELRRELRFSVGNIAQIMLNKLPPLARLAPHKDGMPDNPRFHLPLRTNPDAYWWDEHNNKVHMEAGNWYGPVPYCGILHAAFNDGDTDRIHLIVDFERR